MTIKRVQKKIDWTPEDRARHLAIRKNFEDKPSLEALVACGELSGQGILLGMAAAGEVDRLDGQDGPQVTVRQGDRTLLSVLASFHDNPTTPEFADPPPATPRPDQLPVLQDWLHDLAPGQGRHSQMWVDRPPPLDLRIGEAPTFLGGAQAEGPRSHWMRLPRAVGDDPVLHAALLAYASDYLLLDMAFRSYPERLAPMSVTGFSLDHTLWFHRPVRFDRWHLHTQETVAITGHRGLIRGAIHDEHGHLVASAMQEVLVRPALR